MLKRINFIVVCTGWKCEDFYQRCLDSIVSQNVSLRVSIRIDEAPVSHGDNPIVVSKYKNVDVFQMNNLGRLGKLRNFISAMALMGPSPDDVICDVDLDDYLLPNALRIVEKEYLRYPNLLLTHGSYRMESGKPARFNGRYTSDDFRGSKFLASHLKTFKYKLFRNIKFNSLQSPDGGFFMTCADLALILPMLEMAGLDRIRHIKQCLYCYNDLNPLNDHKVHKQDQVDTTKFIRGMNRYNRVEF